MSQSELLLDKHAKRFIDPKHARKAARGILFDGEGSAYATDGIQGLKFEGFPEVGFSWVRTLGGKVIEEAHDNILNVMQNSFSKELTPAGRFPVKVFRSAADQLLAVYKVDEKSLPVALRGHYRTELLGKDGKLILQFEGLEVSGSIEIGEYSGEDFTLHLNCKRLMDCLSVFDNSHVELLYGRHLLRFESDGIATLLLPII